MPFGTLRIAKTSSMMGVALLPPSWRTSGLVKEGKELKRIKELE